ncbi:MAG: hypothetical protein KAU14_07215, partial [Thermoplasmata archaeon]|nr:hypothetical protein [Thermoplasmata archaeon]
KSEVKPPEEPESKPKEEPSEPEKVVPEPPKPSEPPKPKEPEVDAPPVKEESWDEAVKEEGDIWEDEDFAIPVALKEKLKKESEE